MKKRNRTTDRTFVVFLTITVIIFWFLGYNKNKENIKPYLNKIWQGETIFQELDSEVYLALKSKNPTIKEGYLSFDSAHGYGGKIIVLISSSISGKIFKVMVVEHKESHSFFQKVINRDILDQLCDKEYHEKFELGNDIDNITGATYTTRGIVKATKRAVRKIARIGLKLQIPKEKPPSLKLDASIIVLFLIFLVGFVGTLKKVKYKKIIRWITLLSGLLFIGFIYKDPLSISFTNKLMIGTFPSFFEHFYGYLLFILVFVPVLFLKKNLYCERICPFGALQEGIAAVSGTKRSRFKGIEILRWLRRIVVVGVIAAALIFRKPSISNYEVFDVTFNLIGSTFKFILLGFVLILSFFLVRPWCSMLCPVRVIIETVKIFKNWIKDLTKVFKT